MITYHHLSPEERALIMLECQHGSSIRSIALRLHRSPSTVSRELQRNEIHINTREIAGHWEGDLKEVKGDGGIIF